MQSYIDFVPTLNQIFKIASLKDKDKVLSIQPNTNHIIIQDYTGQSSQHFHIYRNSIHANRYALVSDEKAIKV